MSDQGFEELFQGYPNGGAANELRDRVTIAIADALVELPAALERLKKLRPSKYADLDPGFRAIEGFTVWRIRNLPARGTQKIMELREPYDAASETYHTAAEQRQGLTRKKVGATPELLAAFQLGIQQTLEGMIAWCKEIQPTAK